MQKSFHQMKGDVGMHNAKNHSLHSKMIVQSCVTPPCIIQVQGLRMIVLCTIKKGPQNIKLGETKHYGGAGVTLQALLKKSGSETYVYTPIHKTALIL